MELDTPTLCEAISCGDTETVSSILTDCPPDALDAPDNRGMTPLMCCCLLSGSPHVARMLVKRGSLVNFVEPDSGMTALLLACKTGNLRMAQFLLDKGGDPLARDGCARTCLHWACLSGSTAVVQAVLAVAGAALINLQDASGYTALMTATEYGREDLVKLLLAAGADKSRQNKVTHVAFDIADWYGHKGIADMLGPEPSSESDTVTTPA